MQIRPNELESRILGGPVVELTDIGEADDPGAVDAAYALCKVPIEDVVLIQRLESLGFRFVETQLRLSFRLRKPFDVPGGYRFELVRDEAALEEALAIARDTFTDDRWLVDPELDDARRLSGERYAEYVRRSYERDDERLYRLVANDTGRTLAIKTHRLTGDGTALMLLGGVHADYKNAGVAPIAAYHEYNALLAEGVGQITTHVSARNYAILNLEVRSLKYRVEQTFVVLRKLRAR